MKFLTISTFKDARASLPKDELQKLNIADAEYMIDMKKKMGDKWNFYGIPGWNRYISVGEYESFEEYYQTLQGPSTQAGYSNMESYPLIDINWEEYKAWVKQAKAKK
jgi:hypothetical protein